jgi:hypothetical protein
MEIVDLSKEVEIVTRNKDNGLIAKKQSVDSLSGEKVAFNYRYIDEEGNEVSKERIGFFLKKNGREIEVKPYARSTELVIKGEIPMDRETDFSIESIYELWADDSNTLWKLAKKLHENNSLAVSKYTFGNGFKQSIVLLKPIIQEDKFVFQMLLTQKKKEYTKLMPILKAEKIKESVPTLENLMEAII